MMPALVFFIVGYVDLIYLMIDAGLIAKDLSEALDIISGPCLIHLTIAAKLCRHEIVIGLDTCQLKPVWQEGNRHPARNKSLRRCKESLDVAHDRIEVLSFVQPVAIPGGHLILPVELPLGEGVLFQKMMCLDNNQRGSSLESDAAFDTDDGIAHVYIAADGVW